jgi:hypothetical protein
MDEIRSAVGLGGRVGVWLPSVFPRFGDLVGSPEGGGQVGDLARRTFGLDDHAINQEDLRPHRSPSLIEVTSEVGGDRRPIGLRPLPLAPLDDLLAESLVQTGELRVHLTLKLFGLRSGAGAQATSAALVVFAKPPLSFTNSTIDVE